MIKWKMEDKPSVEKSSSGTEVEHFGGSDTSAMIDIAEQIAQEVDGQVLAMLTHPHKEDGSQLAVIAKHAMDPAEVMKNPATRMRDSLAVSVFEIPATAKSFTDTTHVKKFKTALHVWAEYREYLGKGEGEKAFRASMLFADSRPIVGPFPTIRDARGVLPMFAHDRVKGMTEEQVADCMAFAIAVGGVGGADSLVGMRKYRPEVRPNFDGLMRFYEMMGESQD